ncbi:unnamed protein product, partial [Staurois parvus]
MIPIALGPHELSVRPWVEGSIDWNRSPVVLPCSNWKPDAPPLPPVVFSRCI